MSTHFSGSIIVHRAFAALAAGLLVLTTGCVFPISEHSLSSEADAVLDQRLIGHWDFDAQGNKTDEPVRIVIGQHPTASNALEYVMTRVDEDRKVQVHREQLLTTKLDNGSYVSLSVQDQAKPAGYMIWRYELKPGTPASDGSQSRDTVALHLMENNFFAESIERGELQGTVKRDESSRNLKEIRITAKPEDLRAFIEKHGSKCFTEDGLKFVRMSKP